MKIQDKNLTERRRMAFETTTKIADLLREIVPETHEVVTTVQEFDDFINISVSVYNRKLYVDGCEQHIHKTEYMPTDGTETLNISDAKCKDLIDMLKTEAENYMKLYNQQHGQAEAKQENQPQQ